MANYTIMKTTLETIRAVKECEQVTEEELRLSLCALSAIEHFLREDLIRLIEAIREGKPTHLLKMKAEFAQGTIDRMFTALKTPPDKWLGPNNIPGTPENNERMRIAKNIFKKATGLEL